ncbi:MAG: hypothetical protein ACRDOC_05795 [Streptosporangiaceae bacterium]
MRQSGHYCSRSWPRTGTHRRSEIRDRAEGFFHLDHRVAAALALPDLDAAVKRVVRLLSSTPATG